LAEIAPPLASASIALNTSSIYLGQAIGTGGGGLVYANAGVDYLPWFAVALIALALAVSQIVDRRCKQKGPVVDRP
jgi:predicted MFS family arabinose efflux permease